MNIVPTEEHVRSFLKRVCLEVNIMKIRLGELDIATQQVGRPVVAENDPFTMALQSVSYLEQYLLSKVTNQPKIIRASELPKEPLQ